MNTTPSEFTKESLLVDMLNNLDELAEDKSKILKILKRKISEFDRQLLDDASKLYGKIKTKKLISEIYQ